MIKISKHLFIAICTIGSVLSVTKQPNIVIILADDLGFNDVSFHGSNNFLTPNIDALAYNGIILNRHYAPALCTPSRAALLTGRYPINTGMQHYVIPSDEPWGLPLNETLMPEIFQENGYSTYMVGKWHLGFHKKAFTPTLRGFDYHFGYLGPYIDYYDHTYIDLTKNYSRGYDMRENLNVHYDSNGTYATDLFTDEAIRVIRNHDQSKPMFLYLPHLAPHTANEDDPMQAPEEELRKFDYISDPERRIYAAMVSKLDAAVGKVVQALNDTEMLQNTVILFYADNGAPSIGMHSNTGSNYPLRGQKHSAWDGGLRVASLIWSPLLKSKQSVSEQLIHVTDWFPTLASIAGIEIRPDLKLRLDGGNVWDALQTGKPTFRNSIVHNIDEIIGYSSYLFNNWKYINGTTNPGYNIWLGMLSNETDPRTKKYVRTVLDSNTARVLENFNYFSNSTKLSENTIKILRQSAVVRCESIDYNDPENQKFICDPVREPCLFNIDKDPCEYLNLAWKYPDIVKQLGKDVENYRIKSVPSVRVPPDPKCDPALHNYTWTWWQESNSGMRFSSFDVIAMTFLCVFYSLIL